MHIINGDAPGQSAPGRSKSGFQKEKSTWLLDTAEADYDEQSEHSLPAADGGVNEAPNPPEVPKDYATMRAQFALKGYTLTRSRRVPDGRITYIVERRTGPRHFTHLHDLQAFLNQVMEAAI